MRTMYLSALKDLLLAEDTKVLETVLPNLAAYRAIKQGMNILVRKKADQKREQERLERQGIKAGATTATLNLTNMSTTAKAAATLEAPTKQSTSQGSSPVRGASPMKHQQSLVDKSGLMAQQSIAEIKA